MEMEDEARRTYVVEAMGGKNMPLRRWLIQDKWKSVATWELPKHSQDETRLGETILTTHTQFVYSNFT